MAVVIKGNYVEGCNGVGIRIVGPVEAEIDGNRVQNCAEGVVVTGADSPAKNGGTVGAVVSNAVGSVVGSVISSALKLN